MKKIIFILALFLISFTAAYPVTGVIKSEIEFDNETYYGDLGIYGDIDVEGDIHTEGDVYFKGHTDEDFRFSVDEDTNFTTIVKLIEGLWQPTDFLFGVESVWVGRNVGIAGVGHHLVTEAASGLLHFHTHSEFDGNESTSDAKIMYVYDFLPEQIFQPDDSGSWIGKTFELIAPSTAHTLVSKGYIRTSTVAATQPIRIQTWQGTDDTGMLIFDQWYPASQFPALTEAEVSYDGFLEFEEGFYYFTRYSSDANFSIKTNAAGTFPWVKIDTAMLREDNLLQTQGWFNGTNFTDGQLLIYDRQIYVSNETGVQTGTWESNSNKWGNIASKAFMNFWTKVGNVLSYDGDVSVGGDLNVTGEWYGDGLGNVIDERTITQAVTGLLYGGRVSINPTNTSELIISAGEGQVVDFSNPVSATISRFTWDNISIGIECVPSTDCWILLNGSGSIIQQSNPSTPLEKRTHIDIARAWTANATSTVILGARNSQTYAFNGPKLAEDIGYTIGAVSIWGNGISANGDNSSNLDKTEGEIFRMNYGAGTSPESPHITTSAAQSPIVANWYNFYGNLSNTTLFTVDYSDVGFNCDYYSLNGVKTPVPNNQYQIIDFYWWAYSEAPGPVFGTQTYNTLAAAISNRETEDKAINRGYMTGAMVIGSIACQEGEDWSTATFLPPITGGGGSSGITVHSSLSNLEWDVAGHLFENGGVLDIGGYNFTTNGNVGIGTTSPDYALHLYKTDEHSVLQIEANGSSHGEANLWLKTQSDPGWQIFMDDSNLSVLGDADRLGFYHYGSAAIGMVIDGSSGNVGIGIINPLSTLHVNGSGAVISGDFNSYGSLTETSLVVETGVNTSYLASHNGTERQKMEFHAKEYELETGESGNRNYFVMDTNGQIGIGTTNPTERLTIDVDENNFGGLEVTNSDTGTNAQSSLMLRTVDNPTAFGQDGTYGWLLTARKSNFATTDLQEDLLLSYRDGISWNNIMFLEHDTGNVGIGTTSPTQKLDVNGAINATRVYTSKIDSGSILKLNPDALGIVELFGDADVPDDVNGKELYVWRRAPEGDDYIRFYIDSARKAFIQSDNELTLQAHTDDIIFKVGDNAGAKKFYFKDSDGISVAEIDSNGSAWFDGNVGIGMPSPSNTLSVNGNAYMDGDLDISGTYYGDGSQLTGAGWSGYEIISVTTGSSSDNKAQSAYCSSGKNVTGGGCSISDADTNLAIQKSYPRSGNEWRCRGVETDDVASSWALTVYAICGNI